MMAYLTRLGLWAEDAFAWASTEIRGFPGNVRANWYDKFFRSVSILFGVYAISTIITGLSYALPAVVPAELPPGLDLLISVVPVFVWGILWFGMGVWGLLSAVTGLRSRKAFIALTAVALIWLIAYFGGWVFSGFEGRGYLSTATYIRTIIAPLLLVLVYPVLRRSRRDQAIPDKEI